MSPTPLVLFVHSIGQAVQAAHLMPPATRTLRACSAAFAVALVLLACPSTESGDDVDATVEGRPAGGDRTAGAAEPRSDSPGAADGAPLAGALVVDGGPKAALAGSAAANARLEALQVVLDAGIQRLTAGSAAVDVVAELLRRLEDEPSFNAGRGAAFTDRGTHRLDAALIAGRSHAMGVVFGTRNVRNPIVLARRLLEQGGGTIRVAALADQAAGELGVEKAPQNFFTTPPRLLELRSARRRGEVDAVPGVPGSVGVVALDRYGNLAVGVSTGGAALREADAFSDVALPGAGLFADNRSGAAVVLGPDGSLVRRMAAHAIVERLRHTEPGSAVESVVEELPGGGAVALTAAGTILVSPPETGLWRALADASGRREAGLVRAEEPTPVGDRRGGPPGSSEGGPSSPPRSDGE